MRLRVVALLVVAACASGCSAPRDPGWEGGGVVRGVDPEASQIKIEHGDIEDLMPAMTMSFDVASPALLEGIEPGEYVEFHLVREEQGGFVIDAITHPGGADGRAGFSGGGLPREDPLLDVDAAAPDFVLVDQHGEPISLASMRGRPVLLDFVFTRCPGPCPVLTGIHRDVREGLSDAARARVHSVSITLDPAYDTPEVLLQYIRARRLDAEGWSFVTGEVADVEDAVRAYGVGSVRQPDGNIEHTLVTFLIDPEGRIAKRYLGARHDPAAIRADVETLLAAAG